MINNLHIVGGIAFGFAVIRVSYVYVIFSATSNCMFKVAWKEDFQGQRFFTVRGGPGKFFYFKRMKGVTKF
jgi:hypothetical protein